MKISIGRCRNFELHRSIIIELRNGLRSSNVRLGSLLKSDIEVAIVPQPGSTPIPLLPVAASKSFFEASPSVPNRLDAREFGKVDRVMRKPALST